MHRVVSLDDEEKIYCIIRKSVKNETMELRSSPVPIEVPPGKTRMLESHHQSDFFMRMGAWPFHKICWVAFGNGYLELEHTEHRLKQDDFLIIPAHKPHRFRDDPKHPLALVMFCVSESALNAGDRSRLACLWTEVLSKRGEGVPFAAGSSFGHSNLISSFRQALLEQNQSMSGWEVAVEAGLMNVLLESLRIKTGRRSSASVSRTDALEGVIAYLKTHPYESPTVQDMAGKCGYSARRFSDLFREHTGMTFNLFLNQNRINYACQRLTQTGHIQYACHEAGFQDPAYFYRVFRKIMGMTPGQYLQDPPERHL
jgi:AraC-like DNA-binding protein/mannose-6-phosphate isomerase-like protein (cupin superfamily)